METVRILLLQPRTDNPSPVDQALGARLAAVDSGKIQLEYDSFRHEDLDDLEEVVARWSGKVVGIVGATGVPESTRLGELAVKHRLLCFVANNNPAVWNHRQAIFHIGVPNDLTAAAVARHLVDTLGIKRVYVLHDETDFQTHRVKSTEAAITARGAEVYCRSIRRDDWLDNIRSWQPQIVYVLSSEESSALPLIKKLRETMPTTGLLIGRGSVRPTFLASIGSLAEGILAVDLFRRGAPRGKSEAEFMDVLLRNGIDLPTGNHGFGWDGMKLCTQALIEANGDSIEAARYLEAGIAIEGATGSFRFSPTDHNGRASFNSTTVSCLREGQPFTLTAKH